MLAHFPEHDFVAARHRGEAEVTKIDPFGRTPDQGTLARVFVHNGVFWAVWLHYHPDTRLIR